MAPQAQASFAPSVDHLRAAARSLPDFAEDASGASARTCSVVQGILEATAWPKPPPKEKPKLKENSNFWSIVQRSFLTLSIPFQSRPIKSETGTRFSDPNFRRPSGSLGRNVRVSTGFGTRGGRIAPPKGQALAR